MGQSVIFKKTLAAASVNAICLSQSGTANTAMTLNGAAAAAGFSSQRQVLFTFAASEVGHNFAVVGTDDNGSTVRETVAGAASTATTVLSYKTITSIIPSANTAGTVQVGTNGVGSTPWVLFNSHIPTPNISFAYDVTAGAQNATVEYTTDEFIAPSIGSAIPAASPQPIVRSVTGMVAMTGATIGQLQEPFRGWRLTINSGTGTGQLVGTQAGVSGP